MSLESVLVVVAGCVFVVLVLFVLGSMVSGIETAAKQKPRKAVGLAAIFAVLATAALVPTADGYQWFWSLPSEARLDFGRLILEWVVIAAITIIGFYLTKESRP